MVVVLNGVPGSGRTSIAAAGRWPTVETTLTERTEARALAQSLAGNDVLFVGVRCPLAVILKRLGIGDGPVPKDVVEAHELVHRWQYDLEVDTSVLSPAECAREIARTLVDPPVPSAFARLATVATS